LFFAIQPSVAILGDINDELISALSQIRRVPKELHKRIAELKKGKQSYYKIREQDQSQLGVVDAAARFIYLNRNCFNGIYRTNKSGKFNVPYGGERAGHLPSVEAFISAGRLLRRAKLVSGDFEETIADVGQRDFVYLDPPYATPNRRTFCEYHADSFSPIDFDRLRKALRRIDRKGGTFLLSYADCSFARELGHEWSLKRHRVRRNIAGFGGNRRYAFEVAITNRGNKK